MGDSTIFYFGIFVTILFLTGILYTVREFKTMDQHRQKKDYERGKDIDLEK